MANTFTNAAADILDSDTTLYTCPASTTAVIHNLQINNQDAASAVSVTVKFYDGADTFEIASNIPIPVGSAFSLDKPVNLTAGQRIDIEADVIGRAVGFASILQIT